MGSEIRISKQNGTWFADQADVQSGAAVQWYRHKDVSYTVSLAGSVDRFNGMGGKYWFKVPRGQGTVTRTTKPITPGRGPEEVKYTIFIDDDGTCAEGSSEPKIIIKE